MKLANDWSVGERDVRELGSDEQLLTRDSARSDRFAYSLLVGVAGRSVKVLVAELEGCRMVLRIG